MIKNLRISTALVLSIVMVLMISHTLKAQSYYKFSQSTVTYADLSSPISLNNNTVWDFSTGTPYYNLNIINMLPGFNLFGNIIYDMHIYGGAVQFYHNGLQQIFYIHALGFASPDYMKDKGVGTSSTQSPISYQVTGATPNRILKIQWKNAGHNAFLTDYMNVQLWLYESSNNIEFHYGPSSITNASTTQLLVGLGHAYQQNGYPNQVIEENYLENSVSNPVLSAANASAFVGMPANGTVYTFSRNIVGIEESDNPLSEIILYPNPSTGSFRINLISVKSSTNNLTVIIKNILGETIMEKIVNNQTIAKIDLIDQPKGVYFVSVHDEKNAFNKKIIIY